VAGKTLNPKQEKWARAYAAGKSATQAAIAAGYAPRSAGNTGHRLMKNGDVLARATEMVADEGVTEKEVLRELIRQAFGRNMVDFEPYLEGDKTLADLAADGVNVSLVKRCKRLVRPTQLGDNETHEIELVDGQRALETLARILGMLTEKDDAAAGANAPAPRKIGELGQTADRIAAARKGRYHPGLPRRDNDGGG